MIRAIAKRSAGRRAKEAYVAVLRREPSPEELSEAAAAWALRSLRQRDRIERLRDMIESHEFRTQILPALVATQTGMESSRPIFFLHIPKTGGTSIRMAIADAIGVPALNIYDRWPQPDKRIHTFWPYWAGHAQASFFPDTHTGITMFREARGRILSVYRQQESARAVPHRHGWEFLGGTYRRHDPLPPFSAWLKKRAVSARLRTLNFFMPQHEAAPAATRTVRESQQLLALPPGDIERGVTTTLQRMGAAAWIHDTAAVLRAIESVTGKLLDSLPRENTFEAKSYQHAAVKLTREDLLLIDDVVASDGVVQRTAESIGLIPKLGDDEPYLFEESARRLNFIL